MNALVYKIITTSYKYFIANSMIILFSLFLCSNSGFAAEDDTEPPTLVTVNLAPASINVTSADATVTLTARVTDNLSGFDYGYFYLYSSDQSQYKLLYISQSQRVSGNDLDGEYETTLPFPQFSQAGDWTLRSAYLRDKTTNQQNFNETELSALGSTTVAVTSDPDTTSPIINSITFTPTSIDTSTGDANINFETNITDDLAGFNYAYFYFYSPTNKQYRGARIDASHLLAGGTAFNGTYLTTVTFPQHSEAGDWRIYYTDLYDKAGNRWRHWQTDLDSLDLTTTFTNIADPEDLETPVLAGFDYLPKVINTIDGSDSTTFQFHLTDNLSGFVNGSLSIISPSGGQRQSVSFSTHPTFLIQGNALDGIYQVNKEFPRYSEFGEWKINFNYLSDRTTNRGSYSTSQLEAMGLPAILYMEGIISGGSGDYTIGPDGGTITTDDGILTVDFPAGAVAEETDISITSVGRFDPIRISDGPGLGNTLAEYDFEPDGLIFNQPVTVTMIVDVTDLNQNQRDRLNMYIYTDTDGDGEPDTFVPVPEDQIISISSTTNPDGTVSMTFIMELMHFSTYAVIKPIDVTDNEAPTIDVIVPVNDGAIQDHVTLKAEVTDLSRIDSVHFTIREVDGNDGNNIGYENIPATQQGDSDYWLLDFDSTQLVDGNYIVYVKAIDEYGNEGTSSVVPFTIRNWTVVNLLPASATYRAGRTVPIKFALRVIEQVDPNMTFVRNETLEVRIYDTSDPDNILQTSVFGDNSTDYRINNLNELYITNFKTDKKPTSYTVEVWRAANDFRIESFSFESEKNH